MFTMPVKQALQCAGAVACGFAALPSPYGSHLSHGIFGGSNDVAHENARNSLGSCAKAVPDRWAPTEPGMLSLCAWSGCHVHVIRPTGQPDRAGWLRPAGRPARRPARRRRAPRRAVRGNRQRAGRFARTARPFRGLDDLTAAAVKLGHAPKSKTQRILHARNILQMVAHLAIGIGRITHHHSLTRPEKLKLINRERTSLHGQSALWLRLDQLRCASAKLSCRNRPVSQSRRITAIACAPLGRSRSGRP